MAGFRSWYAELSSRCGLFMLPERTKEGYLWISSCWLDQDQIKSTKDRAVHQQLIVFSATAVAIIQPKA
jgi:hypothetical protein